MEEIALPENVEALSRSELVALSLRINPKWNVGKKWTTAKLLERLRAWQADSTKLWLLSLPRDELDAMQRKIDATSGAVASGRNYQSKKVLAESMLAKMTGTLTGYVNQSVCAFVVCSLDTL